MPLLLRRAIIFTILIYIDKDWPIIKCLKFGITTGLANSTFPPNVLITAYFLQCIGRQCYDGVFNWILPVVEWTRVYVISVKFPSLGEANRKVILNSAGRGHETSALLKCDALGISETKKIVGEPRWKPNGICDSKSAPRNPSGAILVHTVQ